MQGFGPARSSLMESSASPNSDFHSMMENDSLESARAEQSARLPESQPASSAPAKPANSPRWHASSRQASNSKASDGSTKSEKQTSTDATTDTSASPAAELKKTMPNGSLFGDLSLEEQAQVDGTENTAQSNENDGAQSPSGGATSNAAKSAVALLAQRANAGVLTSTILGLEGKPRTAASLTGNDAAESENSLGQSLSALDPDAGSQAGAARQAAAPETRGSLQLNSAADGNADAGDPRIQELTSGAANPNGQVAFEAKLSPAANAANSSASAAQQNSQDQGQASDQGLGKQSAQPSPEDAAPASAAALKAEAALAPPVAAQPVQSVPAAVQHTHASASAQPADSPAATRMESIVEAPSPLASSRHSILVKVPGATTDTSIDLRFIERAGDIHLSVRTPNSEVAQQLRGGLNDLVGKLEHAGIRTEVSSPSTGDAQLSNQSKDQNNQQDSSPDRRGGRNQADSQGQQQPSREQNQSRWFQALADSACLIETSTFSKEQNI